MPEIKKRLGKNGERKYADTIGKVLVRLAGHFQR